MSDTERKCLTCGVIKPISEFVRYRRGWRSHCRPCRLQKRYADPVRNEEIRAARRQYMRRYEREHKATISVRRKGKPRARNRERQRANCAVRDAIRAGKLVRPDRCSRCGGGGRIDGHHRDYSRRLEVVWLCPQCHADEHFAPVAV